MHSCFKLSDLPVLKKWEIPSHHISKHIGRKFKDLENLDAKRSYHWEIQPDFTSNEVDWYEDPERVKLDFNYKSFLDEEESGLKAEATVPHSKQLANTGVKRNNIARNQLKDKFEIIDKGFMRSLITSNLHNSTVNRKKRRKLTGNKEKHNRLRRSNEAYKTGADAENYHHDNVIDEKETKDIDNYNGREKRDIISDFLNKPRGPKAIEKIQTNKKKDIIKDKNKHTAEAKDLLEQSKKAAEHEKIKKNKDGVLGDEQIAAPKNSKAVSKPEISKKVHKSLLISQPQDVKATTREKIDHPKEKLNMDTVPANVARAVAMAMEQLKRDKMWGKVFVHVRPSGQLKVMVQETTKMDDDNTKK